MHFAKLIKGMSAEGSSKAQLGLGHAYSRAKVKFNVHKSDNMIIQSIALLDQLDKDVNTFSMRIREWYSYHFPELVKIVPDNYIFAKCVKVIKNRKELTDDAVAQLEEVIMDSAKAKAVVDASKTSMGMDISQVDLMNIEMFANRVVALAEYRKELSKYLQVIYLVFANKVRITVISGALLGISNDGFKNIYSYSDTFLSAHVSPKLLRFCSFFSEN